MSLGEAFDVDEVSRLRHEVSELKVAKQNYEKRIVVLLEQKRESGEKFVSLLSENSKMVTDCDTLEMNVKTLKGELLEVKNAFKASEERYNESLRSVSLERDEAVAKLGGVEATLAKVQSESLKSFEDGYGVCLDRLAAGGIDVGEHSFAAYLGDMQAMIGGGGSGSSNHPADDEV